MTIWETPSSEIDVMSSTPWTGLNACSIRSETSRSMVSGLAPGYTVVTVTTGISMSGNWSIGRFRSANSPSTTSPSMIIDVKTGRRMATPLRPENREGSSAASSTAGSGISAARIARVVRRAVAVRGVRVWSRS